jgi:hypothetical protein
VTFKSINSIEVVEQGVYYRPTVSNLESADAFSVVDGTLYIFQVTVSGRHDIMREGILKIARKVREGIACQQYVLAFIVPPDIFSHFKSQNFLGTNRAKIAAPRDCIQWAVEMPL